MFFRFVAQTLLACEHFKKAFKVIFILNVQYGIINPRFHFGKSDCKLYELAHNLMRILRRPWLLFLCSQELLLCRPIIILSLKHVLQKIERTFVYKTNS